MVDWPSTNLQLQWVDALLTHTVVGPKVVDKEGADVNKRAQVDHLGSKLHQGAGANVVVPVISSTTQRPRTCQQAHRLQLRRLVGMAYALPVLMCMPSNGTMLHNHPGVLVCVTHI